MIASDFRWLIGHGDLAALSDEDAKTLGSEIYHDFETVCDGISAIGVMLTAMGDDHDSRHALPVGMLLELLGKLARQLSDAEFGTRPDYRREYAEANSGRRT